MLEEKLYTVADVANVTGLTSRTIRNYLKDGTLTGAKIGVQWRFTEEEVRRLFMKQTPGLKTPMQMIRAFAGGRGNDGGYPIEGSADQNVGLSVFDILVSDESKATYIYDEVSRIVEPMSNEVSLTYEYRPSEQVVRIAASGTVTGLDSFVKAIRELDA